MKGHISPRRKKAVWGRAVGLTAIVAALTSVPTVAQQAADLAKVDEVVRQSVISGESARVIMQFNTTDERDTAFNRLLDLGATVRAMDTEAGPALNVLASAAALSGELDGATQVSTDGCTSGNGDGKDRD